jgi:L-cysteine S-thiosulfotransferase
VKPHLLWSCALGAVLLSGVALSQQGEGTPPPARSGFDFLTPELQRLQTDDFANPGLFWVDQGAALWNTPMGSSEQSCADCHGDASQSMADVATRYPAYDSEVGHVINLEGQINQCRQRQGAEPLQYESEDLLGLSAFIAHQALGKPISVSIDGPAHASFERGRQFFYQPRGQLDLSCANCHEENAGMSLRGEPVSQGQINGFPVYRSLWQTLASPHRMFAWCNEAVRAEPYPAGSQDYVDLELFEKWRANGLTIEAPAVRR